MMQTPIVYTIGHSTHSMESFIALLTNAKIAAIADVRSTPYSRRMPHFNREEFRKVLAEHDIEYVFLGTELGGRGIDESMRNQDGRVQYHKIAESAEFRTGLARVRTGIERMRIALMCTESDPLCCHRGILISRLLAKRLKVVHIHANGRLENHTDAELRLLQLTGLSDPDLFRTEEQILTDAYDRQEARIAYVAPATTATVGGRGK